MKSQYRIGQKTGTNDWQIKEAPGWGIVHRAANLLDCAKWLSERKVDIRLVPVLIEYPWKKLGEHIAENPPPAPSRYRCAKCEGGAFELHAPRCPKRTEPSLA